MVDNGSGRHIYYLSQTQLEIYAKAVTVGLWIIGPATACSRISIAIFLLRVVNPGRRWRIFLYGLIIFMGVTFVAQSISSIFRCVPVQKQWDSSAPGTCWSGEASHAFDFWQGSKCMNATPMLGNAMVDIGHQYTPLSATLHLPSYLLCSCGMSKSAGSVKSESAL